ncbi:hypothetical protein M0R45_036782 [Rubus argutus]|uniref:Uncharacterized protein n=1 Tax=Rubus argutus TaxID=59490 RepID=A0AAW1VYV9_RUBAR
MSRGLSLFGKICKRSYTIIKDSNERASTSKKSNSELLPSSSSKTRKASSHPMKDITNGLHVGTKDKKLGPGKPRKSGTGSKMVKGSTSDVKSFSISLTDAPPILRPLIMQLP